ncbi:unnamed protein product [Hyaloperonospora brassicae]|uniref:Uncharacterized protein n=1 Tax=Hyaloperonospora brassicae TaxID=162125 RepID=A0AAV0UL19_HYABA|nr:unnamed protein product [Hyaloperonospora brassicae]
MATPPVGMYLVDALDDTALLTGLEPMRDALSATSEHMRHALPLESSNATLDVEMNIDMDVFCPGAMLDADAFPSDSGDGLFDSRFYPAMSGDDVQEDIEQMLLCGSDEALLHSHDHDTMPGQRCQCRTFAITANRVQTPSKKVGVAIAARDQRKVLRHTFGSGQRLQGFGFDEAAGIDQTPHLEVELTDKRQSASAQDVFATVVERRCTVMAEGRLVVDRETIQALPERPEAKEQNVALTPAHVRQKSCSMEDDQIYSSPLQRSLPVGAVPSPLSSIDFVSLEDVVATPLSNTSRSTVRSNRPATARSLSPADELEKMTASGSKLSIPKMNMLKCNFQVSPGHGTVPLVTPTAMLPPPYFRGALDSPEKRRAHSKTIDSFAQSLSFSFAKDASTGM